MLTHCRSKVPSWAMLLLAGLLGSPVAKAAGELPNWMVRRTMKPW